MPRHYSLLDEDPAATPDTVEVPDMIEDEDGNQYTPDQVRAAALEMVRDEEGRGSLGGLAESRDGERPTPRRIERELDPRNFGDFVKTNIFGGFDAKNVTGKRPTTLFDFATDALQSYSGVDIGRRNAQLIDTDLRRQTAASAQDLNRSRARKADLDAQKTQLDLSSKAGEYISSVFNDVDSDLWEQRLTEIEKDEGITVPKSTKAMLTRWMEKASELGVTSPSEVLEAPELYDEGFVNRTRHTFRLLEKSIQEGEKRRLDTETSGEALGTKQQERQGVDEAIALLQEQADQGDAQAAGRIAALRAGGTSRQQVLESLGGLQPPAGEGRNPKEAQYRRAALERLGAGASEQAITEEMDRLRARSAGRTTEATKTAGLLGAAKRQSQRGMALTNNIITAVKEYGLASTAPEALLVQPIRMLFDSFRKDPKYAVLSAFPATLANIARSIGETGVLTDPDIERMKVAIEPTRTDTMETYMVRIQFVQKAIRAASAELSLAEEEGRDPDPVRLEGTFEGDPLPPGSEATAGAAPAGDVAAAAQAALQKAQSITDPVRRKQFMAAELRRIRGQ